MENTLEKLVKEINNKPFKEEKELISKFHMLMEVYLYNFREKLDAWKLDYETNLYKNTYLNKYVSEK
jgi:hypothetical protein